MVSSGGTSLFACIPTTEVAPAVKKRRPDDHTLSNWSHHRPLLYSAQPLPEHHLLPTQLEFLKAGGCAVGSPVSPAGTSPHTEELGGRGFRSFRGTVLSHWFIYVDDTWVVEPFTEHVNIKFTCQDVGGSSFPGLCGPDDQRR